MRSVVQTLDWYQGHQTSSQIGFNPNGMCLKICRTARGIGSMYPSAIAAQVATPEKHRIRKISDIKRGHVMFFDDPRDSNPYGHIVTVTGRVNGADQNALEDLIVWTNSVSSGRLVVVRANYFAQHWGDPFVFAADWLNGQVLTMEHHAPKPKPPKPPVRPNRLGRIDNAIFELEKARSHHRKKGHPRIVKALTRDINTLSKTKRELTRS